MSLEKLEYIWLDGSETQGLRSKTKIFDTDKEEITPGPNGLFSVDDLADWSFDGSSTKQAEGGSSDCLIRPVRTYRDPARRNGHFVLCDVLNADHSPHTTNARSTVDQTMTEGFWIGFEQEYILMNDNNRPIGFPAGGFPEPQGPYYCSVGSHHVAGRDIVEKHLDLCLDAGLGIVGINAEVMLGQWEYQCFRENALHAADDLTMSRYLLSRIAEEQGIIVNLEPKPLSGDWNGSGMHTNFSNERLREEGGEEYIADIMTAFENRVPEHMAVYGQGNRDRLTGAHETASADQFSYGVSDRGASVRIPIWTVEHDMKGYLEDRRPASNADPYKVIKVVMESVALADKK